VVLVVDDEALVLRQFVRVLSAGGWQVESTTDPEEALAMLSQNPTGFQVAVLDFLMPKLNGAELATRLHKINPRLPIVLCSGFIAGSAPEEFERAGFFAVMQKPFEPDELLLRVQEAAQALE